MNKKVLKRLNKVENISADVRDNYITIYVDNAWGEDFEFEIDRSTTKQELLDIVEYCDNYDVGDHFCMWYGANNGEPSDPQDLLDNCKEIGESLDKLSIEAYRIYSRL